MLVLNFMSLADLPSTQPSSEKASLTVFQPGDFYKYFNCLLENEVLTVTGQRSFDLFRAQVRQNLEVLHEKLFSSCKSLT